MHPLNSTSIVAQICTHLFSRANVLSVIKAQRFHIPLRPEAMREAVYLAFQPWAARMPDHVFDRAWQQLEQHPSNQYQAGWLPGALQILADEFLMPRHGQLYVKLDKFGAWQQSIVSRMSGVAIQAAAYAWPDEDKFMPGLEAPDWLKGPVNTIWARNQSPVMYPFDPAVEDYLQREGLHETHLHLNGTTSAEICWLRALYKPEEASAEFTKKWAEQDVPGYRLQELAKSVNPDLTPLELKQQLYVARELRAWLIAAATERIPGQMTSPCCYEELLNPSALAPEVCDVDLLLDKDSGVAGERRWIYLLLQRLRKKPSVTFERMLHLYLLLQNLYYRLLVQHEEHYGFDQFQKFTWSELRFPEEDSYFDRFRILHGPEARSQTDCLEGRFAPKGDVAGNLKLLQQILSDYWRYLQPGGLTGSAPPAPQEFSQLLAQLDECHPSCISDRKRMRLALVSHFIKWDDGTKTGTPYRYFSLRKTLNQQAHAVIGTLRDYPRLRRWWRGIDAAANEMHAPPEVFASCYRLCRRAGVTRRTYHAGEDFPHLLSGLRVMWDALVLLELGEGDRIGHGTAMGIAPRLWIDSMPDSLLVAKGDWLLDLLATWRFLRQAGLMAEAYQVECDLAQLACELFDEDISPAALERAMDLRWMNLAYVEECLNAKGQQGFDMTPLHDFERAEKQQVMREIQKRRADVERLWHWMSDSTLRKRCLELQSVRTDYLTADIYLRIQQQLMQLVVKRRVLIETLPSSNVRISQYSDFRQHHALRWMGVPGFKQEGDPPIMVALGSDDPGIFAGDLKGEFYQLYAVLQAHCHDKEALRYLAPLNERGREYRFHDPLLVP